jgi:membrane protease YdiL (CAAX protease family)
VDAPGPQKDHTVQQDPRQDRPHSEHPPGAGAWNARDASGLRGNAEGDGREGSQPHTDESGPPPPPPDAARTPSQADTSAGSETDAVRTPPRGGTRTGSQADSAHRPPAGTAWPPPPPPAGPRTPLPPVPPPGASPRGEGDTSPPDHKPRPSAADAVVLPLWILGGQLLAGIAVLPGMIFAADPEGTMSVLIAVSAVLGWLAVVAGTALWLRYRRAWEPSWLTGHRPRSAWLPAAIGVGGAVGGLIGVQVVVGIVSWLTGAEPPEQEIFELLDDPVIAWVMGGIAVLIAPAVEEIVFRGVMLDVMARRWNWWLAAVAQAAAFSAIHIETLWSPSMFLALGLLGFVFAWLRRVTGSLVAPIVAHLVFNAISLGVATLLGASVPVGAGVLA